MDPFSVIIDPLLVSSILSKVADIIIQEKERFGDKRQIERIEEELSYMVAFTQHLEHEGPNTNQLELVEEIRSFALEAYDVIDNFLRWRKNGILNLFHKFDIDKELDQISVKMKEITERIKNYEKPKTSIVVTVETPGPSAGVGDRATTIVSPALEKLDYILTQNLMVLDREVIEKAEHVRDEDLGDTQNIVSNLNSTRESSQRAQVWLKEVEDICDYTVAAAEKFIARRERPLTVAWMGPFLSRFEQYATERNFMKQLEYISTQFGDALYRRWIFGDGGKDMHMGDKMPSRSRPVPSLSWETFWPRYLWDQYLSFVKAISGPIISSYISQYQELRQIGNGIRDPNNTPFLWLSLDENLKTTLRYLALMNAFLSDIKSAEGLNERQKVWVDQLKDVARKGDSLVAAYPKHGFLYLNRRIIFARDIYELLNEIIDISERKNIYGIANIQGRREESVSTGTGLGPGIQGSTSEIIVEVEQNDNSHAPPASSYRRITELEQKFQLIKGEKQLMDALFRDVEEIGELDERSKIWVEHMRRIADENAPVFNERTSEWRHIPMAVLNHILKCLLGLDNMGNKLDRIRVEIAEASRRRNAYGLVQLQSRAESLSTVQTLSRGTQLPSLVDKQSSIVGFDGDVEALTAELLSEKENRCIITIVGIKGIGKTELAKLIFNNKAATDHFACRIWVSGYSSCTVEQLLEKIAKEVAAQTMTGQPDTWTTQHTTLALATLATTKYLIVVDGIKNCLDTLTKAIPESRASIILFTTRTKNEAPQVSASLVYHLQLLDDESSWTLFKRNLVKPEQLKEFGEKIVAECGGLPSQILKMTDMLSRKHVTVKEWSIVQNELYQGQNPWSEILNTVEKLPSYLRACLFYFELFPAAFEIPVRRLVVPWIAEGLVHNSKDQGPPEVVAESYLTRLIELNMVQVAKRKPNGKVKTCRFPNALRELLLRKANEPRSPRVHTTTDLNAVQKNFTIRRVADRLDQNDVFHKHIHGNTTSDSASLAKYYKDVLSFLSFDTQEGSKPGQDISNFLNLCISSKCLSLLRVLDLEDVYKPELPENIDKLTRLRYLGLRWTYLESLPSSISKLLKLQTLDLKHTYIHTLTSSIWKMELRHLFLSETYRTKFPPKPRGAGDSLSDLQTLWGLFVDEETPVEGGLDKLVNIRKLGIACQSMSLEQRAMESQLDAVANWIVNLKYLQSLRLKSRDEEGQPWNINLKSLKEHNNLTDIYLLGYFNNPSILYHLPSSLVELTLSHSKLKEDPMQILKDLPNLQSLSLLAESYVEKTLVCNSQSFPQLHVLRIWKLEELEEWIIEQEALPSLRQLEIRSCPDIKMLPAGLKHVKSLLELKLTNMSMEISNDDKHNILPNCRVHVYNFQ